MLVSSETILISYFIKCFNRALYLFKKIAAQYQYIIVVILES